MKMSERPERSGVARGLPSSKWTVSPPSSRSIRHRRICASTASTDDISELAAPMDAASPFKMGPSRGRAT